MMIAPRWRPEEHVVLDLRGHDDRQIDGALPLCRERLDELLAEDDESKLTRSAWRRGVVGVKRSALHCLLHERPSSRRGLLRDARGSPCVWEGWREGDDGGREPPGA